MCYQLNGSFGKSTNLIERRERKKSWMLDSEERQKEENENYKFAEFLNVFRRVRVVRISRLDFL